MSYAPSLAFRPSHTKFFSSSSSFSSSRRFLHLLILRPFSSSSSAALSLSLEPELSSFDYGPSLRRGRRPPSAPDIVRDDRAEGGGAAIERESFARVFDIAALRVPADECAALERRLRGHLLNWPRVRNIARVPGDDIDPAIGRMLRGAAGDGGQRMEALTRKVRHDKSSSLSEEEEEEEVVEPLSPVLYREKLVKEFNSRGFLNFRNLAKISRPKIKKKKLRTKEEDGEEEKGAKDASGKNSFAAIEVVGSGQEMKEDDFSGLLGEDFVGESWRGPTRLLLLDERYAKKCLDELPEAVKALLNISSPQTSSIMFELVQCRLTLSYSYWHMNEILQAILPEGMIIPTGFETVGHIAHLNLRDEHLPYKKIIAQVVLDKNRPKIKTVVNKIDAIQNYYRTMQLEVLAGNHSLVTTVIENGTHFQVDLSAVYWNSRLATERQRLVYSFTSSDVICDVFSGVGPIALSAAKKVKHVYANDLNPNAVEYLERNIVLNKLDRKVEVFNMEGRRFITAMFSSRLSYSVTQVVMNLPNDAVGFLDSFRGVFQNKPRESCTLPRVHVYGFSKSQNPEYDFQERINMVLCETVSDVEMRRVRLVAPGKWMLYASFVLPQAVAFER